MASSIVERPTIRRALVALTVLLTITAVGGAGAGATPPSPTISPAKAAAGWLARQLTDGDHFEVKFGDETFPDQGLTIDGVRIDELLKKVGVASRRRAK